MIETVAGVVGALVLLLGLAIASIGLYGMLRKPAIFEQLHAAGLVTGPGVILVLLASLASASTEIATSAVLVVAFVLITSSLSTHAIALAAWRSGGAATGTRGGVDANRLGTVTGADARSKAAMRVLLAHDGSPGADVATSLVASLPWVQGSTIRVIGAIEGDLQPVAAAEPAGRPAEHAPDEFAAVLEAAASILQRPGLSVDHVIRRGDAATTIATEAERLGADLVVIGSRGLGPVRTLLLGSVAAEVIDAAPCPVLIGRVPTVREVLLATDGSRASDTATAAVASWPMFEGVPIRVLSVATEVPQYGDLPATGTIREAIETTRQQQVADAAAIRLRDAGRQALPYIRTGDAAAKIRAFAQAQAIDLIVLGSRGRTGLRRALLGSVVREVLSSTEISVLVVPAADR